MREWWEGPPYLKYSDSVALVSLCHSDLNLELLWYDSLQLLLIFKNLQAEERLRVSSNYTFKLGFPSLLSNAVGAIFLCLVATCNFYFDYLS